MKIKPKPAANWLNTRLDHEDARLLTHWQDTTGLPMRLLISVIVANWQETLANPRATDLQLTKWWGDRLLWEHDAAEAKEVARRLRQRKPRLTPDLKDR